jgi:hypothetical protein
MTQSWYQLDWIWTATAWALAALGAALLLWSLFWDRARGRKRCPKCWYDLSQTPPQPIDGVDAWKCPECGRVSREKQLFRTRRQWRRALLALLVFVLADAAESVPRAAQTGRAAFVPSLLLLACVPADPPPFSTTLAPTNSDERWWREVCLRYGTNDGCLRPMWAPSRIALAWGAARAVRSSTTDIGRYNAAFVLAQVDPDAPERFQGAAKATVIRACSDAAYATCTTYQDVCMHKGHIGVRDELIACTAFERPKRFRFEYLSEHPMQNTFTIRGVIWQDGAAAKQWWTIDPEQVDESPDPRMPIAAFTGVSDSTSHTIPTRLLWSPVRLGNLWLLADDVCDKRECYHIRDANGSWVDDVWIDKKTFGILRIERDAPFYDITVYRPRFNQPVDKGAFAFDPAAPAQTPLGDGEKTADELRPLLGPRRIGQKK